MRKLLISILLASAAASPAIAEPWQHDRHDNNDRAQAHEERQQARDEGRRGGGDNNERPHFEMRQQVQQQESSRGGGFDRSRFEGRQNVAPQQVQVQEQAYGRRGGNFEGYRQNRIEQSTQVDAQREYYRRDRSGWNGGNAVQQQQIEQAQRSGSWSRDRGSWSRDRDGDYRQRQQSQDQSREGSRWSGGWNRDWRNDRRYDWRRYRDHHRSVFHLGIYYDPFGYSYRPFGIGYRLQPVYFGNQYWIDPALYGLPYPPPGTQWVRYWNDAVLVDMYSGEVIDVIRDFFW